MKRSSWWMTKKSSQICCDTGSGAVTTKLPVPVTVWKHCRKRDPLPPPSFCHDVLLPDLDGVLVCEILHRQIETRSAPINKGSAVTSDPTRSATKLAGARAYLGKPLDSSALECASQKFLASACQSPQT